MKLSIILVHYRDSERLRALLTSLPSAVPSVEYEVIVVDNDSDCQSFREQCRRDFPAVRLIENAQNVGFGRGMNQGVEAARGETVLLLNPDVEVTPGFLDPLLTALEQPRIGVVGPAVFRPNGRRQLTAHRRFPNLLTVFVEYCLPVQVVLSRWFSRWHPHDESEARHATSHATAHLTGVALLFRRETFRAVGGFDRDFFLYFEETDLQHRLHQRGLSAWYCAESPLIHYGSIGKRFAQASPHFLSSLERYWRLWSPLTRPSTLRGVIAAATALSFMALLLVSPLALVQRGAARKLGRYVRGYLAISRWLVSRSAA